MIRLLIISNVKSKELAEFLEQRGTFEIYKCYDSLSANAADIQNSIIKVDKTLYLYQLDEKGNSNINIRADMQLLQNMLKGNSFFSLGEIIFMTQDGEQGLQAERYFMSVMQECKYTNYMVQKETEKISFTTVYSGLMGITEDSKIKNTYKPLWRAERNSDSTLAYEKQGDSELFLEPFSFDKLRKYEQQKRLSAKAASSIEIKDLSDGELKKFQEPAFGQISVSRVSTNCQTIIITGKSKSGLSTWTVSLAVSTQSAGKNVLILDYTSNRDIEKTMKDGGVSFTEARMKELVGQHVNGSGIFLCKVKNNRESAVRLEFLQHYFSMEQNIFDYVLLAVSKEDFMQVFKSVRSTVKQVYLTVTARHSDVVELQQYIDVLKGKKITVIMNEGLTLTNENYLDQEAVKKLLVFFEPRVVAAIWFNNFNLKDTLYQKIVKAGEG